MSIGFRLGSGIPEPGSKEVSGSSFEKLANGELPGILGVAHRVSKVWTEPRNGNLWLRRAQMSLQSYGIVRAYYEETKRREIGEDDKLDAELKKRNLKSPMYLSEAAELVWRELKLAEEPFKVHKIQDAALVQFDCGAWFCFAVASTLTMADQLNGFWGKLFVVAANRPELVATSEILRAKVSSLVWNRIGGSIEFTNHYDPTYGIHTLALNAAVLPNDFILPQDVNATISDIVSRSKKFAAANLSRKILLHGSPGTGKTTLASTLAKLVGDNRGFRIDPELLTSHEIGTSQVELMTRLLKPTVLQIDDFDRLPNISAILHYIERCNVPIVVGTVNSIEPIDPAMLRPGRFDEIWNVAEPDDGWRSLILNHFAKKFKLNLPSDTSSRMKGLSQADIQEVLKVVSVLGIDMLDAEINRVRLQRGYYTQDKIDNFLTKGMETSK